MKTFENIAIRLILLLAVLFCLGLDVYTDYNSPIYTIELSADANVVDDGLDSNSDISDELQMDLVYDFSSINEPILRIPNSKKLILTQNYTFSNWQPPRISNFRI